MRKKDKYIKYELQKRVKSKLHKNIEYTRVGVVVITTEQANSKKCSFKQRFSCLFTCR